MDRRTLIQAFGALPFVAIQFPKDKNGESVKAVGITPGGHVVFFDTAAIDLNALDGADFDGMDLTFVEVYLKSGKTIEDAVRIYKFEDEENK